MGLKIKYKGNVIADSAVSCSKILETAGNYLEDNITIEYDRSSIDFYDYDGTLIKHCTLDDINRMQSLPTISSKGGMTSHGWNWSLEDIKTYLTSQDKLSVGAVYGTTDGHTKIYMTLTDSTKMSMPFYIDTLVGGTLNIDWGDGTTSTVTTSGTINHTWSISSFPQNVVIDIEYTGNGYYRGNDYSFFRSRASDTTGNYFANCVTEVRLGNGLDISGTGAFYNFQSLTTIVLSNGITSIGRNAFVSCSKLKCVIIGDGVTSIDSFAFQGCSSLKCLSMPNSVTSLGQQIINGCTSLTNICIPNSVTSIGNSTFWGSSLTEAVVPDTVTALGNYAFYQSILLTDIIIGNGVTSIGDSSFDGCSNLKNIVISNSVATISGNAFQECNSLREIYLPSGITSLGNLPFAYCRGLENIDVDINNQNYSSEDGTLFNKTKTILIRHPYKSPKTEYVIPSTVETIDRYAFRQCNSLESIVIPNNVTEIRESAFYACESLSGTIVIPNSITSIGYQAFAPYNYSSTLPTRRYDFTSWTIADLDACTFGSYIFNYIKNAPDSRIVFANSEIAEYAKTIEELSGYADYITYE